MKTREELCKMLEEDIEVFRQNMRDGASKGLNIDGRLKELAESYLMFLEVQND